MIFPLIAMMFLGVGYGPPGQYDVLEALQRRYHNPHGTFLDPVVNSDQYELRFNNYPVDTVLQRCDPFLGRTGSSARLSARNGYVCLVEVIPYAVPAFYVSGIFTYNGLEWIYIGDAQAREIRPQETINRKNVTRRPRIILKPGSIAYDGNPEYPINDVSSPYDEILGFDKP